MANEIRIERAAVALSRNALRTIAAHGSRKCLDALRMHEVDGEGACTIGFYLGLTTRQADAAIDAGRELAGRESLRATDNDLPPAASLRGMPDAP